MDLARDARSRIATAMTAALFLATTATVGSGAPVKVTDAATEGRSTLITVFGDFATVRDTRNLSLTEGTNRVSFPGISPQLSPQTAFLTDVRSDHPLWVTEQSFEASLVTSGSLFQSYVGRTVYVIVTNPTTGRSSRESATLVSTDGPILKFKDRIETGVPPFGRIVYPSIPSSLLTAPAFEADVATTAAGASRVALTYLTGGFGWSADYIMRLDPSIDKADIDVLATVTNASGVAYPDARLQFVSGDVQRAQAETFSGAKVIGHVTTAAASSVTADTYEVTGAVRQPLLEFYLYTVPQTTTLLQDETKQFSLLAAHDVPVHESFETDDSISTDDISSDGETPLGVETYVGFQNIGPKLGIPLPNGLAHLYKDDSSGVAEFVGDAGVPRTPRLGSVRLDLGQSSDVSAKHVQTAFHNQYGLPTPPPGTRAVYVSGDERLLYTDVSERVDISNAKTTPVEVDVIVSMPEGWSITSESSKHETISSSIVRWRITVPGSATIPLVYSVRVKPAGD